MKKNIIYIYNKIKIIYSNKNEKVNYIIQFIYIIDILYIIVYIYEFYNIINYNNIIIK